MSQSGVSGAVTSTERCALMEAICCKQSRRLVGLRPPAIPLAKPPPVEDCSGQ